MLRVIFVFLYNKEEFIERKIVQYADLQTRVEDNENKSEQYERSLIGLSHKQRSNRSNYIYKQPGLVFSWLRGSQAG